MHQESIDPTSLNIPGLYIYTASVTAHAETLYFLVKIPDGDHYLAVSAPANSAYFTSTNTDFVGKPWTSGEHNLLLCPLNAENAAALRKRLTWLRPTIQGLRTTVGLGDRLGLASVGHLRAVREVGGHLIPFPAQQSIREMKRTGRTPQQVMDAAMWGIFAEGWRTGFGADADHLKSPEDIESCLAAGYTFYTFDPGEYVNGEAEQIPVHELLQHLEKLPWDQLNDNPTSLLARYPSATIHCEGYAISLDEDSIKRAAIKYGRAIAHVAMLYTHLARAGAGHAWEVEVSVDETETPTTPLEHVYIATELRRLGVQWVSLAPRFIGRFEKGVDYIGDINAFEGDFAIHAAVARALGPYKLSLHSGSDKFSIYEIAARLTHGVIHLKTAGTSYLEALRTISVLEPELLRAIYTFACERYEVDRASYHVSAQLTQAPLPSSLTDTELPTLLQQFDAREILHVTFGSVLTAQNSAGEWLFYDRIMHTLKNHPEAYAADLQKHFVRHLQPFALWSVSAHLSDRLS